jgi:hypothetical protein
MYASIPRASRTWQRVVITDFECKQLLTLRKNLTASSMINTEFFNPHPAHQFTANIEHAM